MSIFRLWVVLSAAAFFSGCRTASPPSPALACKQPFPYESFTLASSVLGEARTINVYLPPNYSTSSSTVTYPVLYMPDGGIGEDFIHVADAIHAGITYEILRPLIIVGVENTVRRRDLAPPTEVEDEKKRAPQAGGSTKFRAFLRNELMPQIRERYRAGDETAIVGESLAGLFIVETLLLEPDLFDSYIALSPSLQWNKQATVNIADEKLKSLPTQPITLYLSSANEEEIIAATERLTFILTAAAPKSLKWTYHPLPTEFHDTIYRAASPRAFRMIFGR